MRGYAPLLIPTYMIELNHFQGEEIAFNIELYSDTEQTKPINIDSLSDVIIYVYSNACMVAKLSKSQRDGYIKLLRNNAYQYAGVISSGLSKKISPGNLTMEINLSYESSDTPDKKWNCIQKASIGQLKKSLIKNES